MTITGLGAAGPATAQAAVSGSWPQLEGNAAHTGDEPGENSINRGNARQLSVAWTAPLPAGEGTGNDVVVTGGVLYTSDGPVVTALNAQTGAQLWQLTFPSYVDTPSVADGLVLVGYGEQLHAHVKTYIRALNATTGATVWTRKIGSIDSPITVTAHLAYFLTGTQVEAIELSNGYKFWISPGLAGCSLSAPTVADGYVLVGAGGDVSALHASTGALAWHDTLSDGCEGSTNNWVPAISQGTVYAGLIDGVDAISLTSGTVLWHTPSTSGVVFPVTLTSQYVLASVDSTSQLVALNRSTGAQVWQTAFAKSEEIVGTYVFGNLAWFLQQPNAGGGGTRINAVDAGTGNRDFSSVTYADQDQGFPPVADAGRVYMSTGNEVVCYALPGAA
ncbi:MAG: PQQ-binding-like beta-propeller repeat protein [Streptosporangiaceae bacterium]